MSLLCRFGCSGGGSPLLSEHWVPPTYFHLTSFLLSKRPGASRRKPGLLHISSQSPLLSSRLAFPSCTLS